MHLFQRLIQTEADLMRLEEVHSSLFTEHKNLQEDYERIHIYVEVNILVLFVCFFVCEGPSITGSEPFLRWNIDFKP